MNKGVKKLFFNDYSHFHQGQNFFITHCREKFIFIMYGEKKPKTTEEYSISLKLISSGLIIKSSTDDRYVLRILS